MNKHLITTMLCLIVVLGYLFLNTDYFYTDSLEWTGLKFLTEEEMAGFLKFSGSNVLRVDSRKIGDRLLSHPWVEGVRTHWQWPNHYIVEVAERSPLALIPTGESFFLLDAKGQLLPPPLGIQMYTLPLVTNIDLDSRDQLQLAARLFSRLPSQLVDVISEWNAEERYFVTRQGTQVLLGDLEELDHKFELLVLILDDLGAKGQSANRIDLRIVKNPVVITK